MLSIGVLGAILRTKVHRVEAIFWRTRAISQA